MAPAYAEAGAPKPMRIAKKACLNLRITLTRLDDLIEEVHTTIPPNQRAEIASMLIEMRKEIHSMIDEAIRFKCAIQKSARQ